MEPIRGGGGVHRKTKRKKKMTKGGDSDEVDSNVLFGAQPQQSFDWWDDFSNRIAGTNILRLVSWF